MERGRHLGSGRQGQTRARLGRVPLQSPGEIQLYEPNAKMRIDEDELFRSGRAKALMDEIGFTTLLKRSLVFSESGRGERQRASPCSAPRRRG
jgi:hypothetical protein